MVSAYSAFPNKGMRVQPHLIRKVYSRDGSLLEESKETAFKVTSEYVALTMVEMMQGVVKAGGTATAASASGHLLAGKTGTVNDQTDVWFIGYTPSFVTGVWMGNPERKESLGAGMTGSKGALPYFNEFMNPFMKDKERESFPKAPPMPSDIKALAEQRKREEQEKLEKAALEGKKIVVTYNPLAKPITRKRNSSSGGGEEVSTDSTITTPTDTAVPETNPVPGVTPRTTDDPPKPNPKPPVAVPPVKKPEVPAADKPKTEAPKRTGKKGRGEDDN
jgi:penicillin-binding protein 1A